MFAATEAAVRAFLALYEGGFWLSMYRDAGPLGAVTAGTGLRLSPGDALRLGGQAALNAYRAVAALPAAKNAGWYATQNSFRFTAEALQGEFDSRLDRAELALEAQIANWKELPQNAIVAMLDIAWQTGTNLTQWHKLRLALASRNWAVCANECATNLAEGGNAERNAARKKLFDDLSLAA